MNDTRVFGQSTSPDARVGLRARADALQGSPAGKAAWKRIESVHRFSSNFSILAVLITVVAGLIALFAAIGELIGHPGLMAQGAFLPAVALAFLLPLAALTDKSLSDGIGHE